jgi:hypothetical protein
MRLIMSSPLHNLSGLLLSYSPADLASGDTTRTKGLPMPRMLAERELTNEGPLADPLNRSAPRERRRVTVNLGESPLTWLHARGMLSDAQHAAGERLRADWERAQLAPSITMRWDPVRSGGGTSGLEPGERQIAARARFDAAVAAAGPGLSDILWRVVCAGEGLPEAERGLAWPARSGKLVLKLALDRLAVFYKLA